MRISIFGIGYVGAVSSGCLAQLGHQVVGVDTAADKVAMLRAGRSPIVEEDIDRIIADAVAAGTPDRHDGRQPGEWRTPKSPSSPSARPAPPTAACRCARWSK